MIRIWNVQNWVVYSTGQVQEEGMNPGLEGFAVQTGLTSQTVTWKAWPGRWGWMVQVSNIFTAKRECFQGSTLNLGLEVAAACKRFANAET